MTIKNIRKSTVASFAGIVGSLLVVLGASPMAANAAPLGGSNASASFGVSQFLMAAPAGIFRGMTMNQLADGHTLLSYSQQNQDTAVWQFKAVLLDPSGVASEPIVIADNVWVANPGAHTMPTISKSSNGQFFTTWVHETIGEALDTLEVLGSVSTDGVNFSAPFVVTTPIANACAGQQQERDGCGYVRLAQAIDGNGALSATQALVNGGLIGDVGGPGANTTVNVQTETGAVNKSFSAPVVLATLRDCYSMSETGFGAGFGITWGGYLTNGNFEFAATTNQKPAKNVWSAKHVLLGNENNVAEGVWQQRDAKTATVVFNSQINSPKIRVADFDLAKGKWAKPVVLSTGGDSIVYQSVASAIDANGKVFVVWPTYNQTNAVSKILYATQAKGAKGSVVQELYSQNGSVTNFQLLIAGGLPLISYSAEGVGAVSRVIANGTFGEQKLVPTDSLTPAQASFAMLPNGDALAVTTSYDNNQDFFSAVPLKLSGAPVASVSALVARSKVLAKPIKKSKQQLSITATTWASYSGVTSQSVQWIRCSTQVQSAQVGLPFGCSEIAGASGKTYLVGKADKGFYLTYVAKASNAFGSNQIVAVSTAAIK